MTAFRIPFVPNAQKFSVFLSGTEYVLVLKWNQFSACWVLDIRTTADVPIVSGLPIVTGADILEQFAYLEIGGAVIAQTENNPDAVPTYVNLGSTSNVFYVTSDA